MKNLADNMNGHGLFGGRVVLHGAVRELAEQLIFDMAQSAMMFRGAAKSPEMVSSFDLHRRSIQFWLKDLDLDRGLTRDQAGFLLRNADVQGQNAGWKNTKRINEYLELVEKLGELLKD